MRRPEFFVDYWVKGVPGRKRRLFYTYESYSNFRYYVYHNKNLILGIHGMY